MSYDLTAVKKIQVISKVGGEEITTTLNPKFLINESAAHSNVTSAINALYRLSDLSVYDIVLTREVSLKREPIQYETLDDTGTWYTGKNIGAVGSSMLHEVQLNTLANIITTKFSVPSILENVAISTTALRTGNKVLITVTFYKAFSSTQSTTGYLTLYTQNSAVRKSIPMFINQEKPTEEQTGGI